MIVCGVFFRTTAIQPILPQKWNGDSSHGFLDVASRQLENGARAHAQAQTV